MLLCPVINGELLHVVKTTVTLDPRAQNKQPTVRESEKVDDRASNKELWKKVSFISANLVSQCLRCF